MSRDGTITVDRVWKRFRPDRRRMLLRDEVANLAARVRGDDRRAWQWALRDVSFRAEPGDSIGLVGVNGSGKSTLLKLLTRVMYPFAGRIAVTGRVGALIEVRAGIHPDLTGGENVYLYGSLLGLSRKDVARRFDDIVAFAELEDAIDRQVKFYSSGMQMRLGFAVAAYLEPDVLLVDEVLAVGDASFQQRCLDRMREVLSQGTSLVFVSHDLAAVEATCSRGIWLDHGVVQADGPAPEVLRSYRHSIEAAAQVAAAPMGAVRLVKAEALGEEGRGPVTQGPLWLNLTVESSQPRSASIHVGISDGPATPIFVVRRDVALAPGETDLTCRMTNLPLPRGRFFLWVGVLDAKGNDLLPWHPATALDVTGPDLDPPPRAVVRPAPVHVAVEWEVQT